MSEWICYGAAESCARQQESSDPQEFLEVAPEFGFVVNFLEFVLRVLRAFVVNPLSHRIARLSLSHEQATGRADILDGFQPL